jgi:hypothetical protein
MILLVYLTGYTFALQNYIVIHRRLGQPLPNQLPNTTHFMGIISNGMRPESRGTQAIVRPKYALLATKDILCVFT